MRKKISMLLAVLLLICCTGCGAAQTSPSEDIYNDEERLSTLYSSYSMERASQEINGQKMTGEYDTMNGMVMVWTYDAPEDMALDVRYLFHVSEGSVKLVLLDEYGKLSTITELSKPTEMDDYAVAELSLKKGLNWIKIVGTDDAVVEFDMMIYEGSFVAL